LHARLEVAPPPGAPPRPAAARRDRVRAAGAAGGAAEGGAVKHDEMNCKRPILEDLADYEDGPMPERERPELEAPPSPRPPCVTFLHSYRATGRTLKMLKPREVPKNLAEAVWNFVRERCPKKS